MVHQLSEEERFAFLILNCEKTQDEIRTETLAVVEVRDALDMYRGSDHSNSDARESLTRVIVELETLIQGYNMA